MFATSLALIAQEFEGRERATAIGIWGATVGGAVAIGPLVGGAAHRGPRLGVDLLRQRPDRDRGDRAHRDQARQRQGAPTRSRSTGPGLVDLLARRSSLLDLRADPRQRRGLGQPADPRLADRRRRAAGRLRRDRAAARATRCSTSSLFRKPAFAGVSIVAFALSAGMFAMFLYLTLYIQDVLGYSPLAGRPALPAAHAALVLRRADLRAALEPRSRRGRCSASA